MKKVFLLPIYFLFFCIVVPLGAAFFAPQSEGAVETTASKGETVTVWNKADDTTHTLDMTDYITGVVAAEMPASFEVEALKAQAVAAATYALYRQGSHENGCDVCTDSAHCQAYLSQDEMRAKWGSEYDTYYSKIRSAAESVAGEYLSYNSEPVMAVFHSMGGGKTESSADVWGEVVPYLVSVDSPGEDAATNFYSSVTVTFEEFKNKILSQYLTAVISSQYDVSEPILTDGGHVKSIIVGGCSITGTEMRTMFDLRSTMFTITFDADSVTFNVTGYGHGVGMSQYGANAMAKEGKTYEEILSHYYSGATLEK